MDGRFGMEILGVRNESWTKWSDGVTTIVVPTLRAVLGYVALCCVEYSFWRVGLDLGRGVAGNIYFCSQYSPVVVISIFSVSFQSVSEDGHWDYSFCFWYEGTTRLPNKRKGFPTSFGCTSRKRPELVLLSGHTPRVIVIIAAVILPLLSLVLLLRRSLLSLFVFDIPLHDGRHTVAAHSRCA
jgi:hypothetical protein